MKVYFTATSFDEVLKDYGRDKSITNQRKLEFKPTKWD